MVQLWSGAGWLYATAVILAANAITSRVLGTEITVAPIIAILLAVVAGAGGVHLDHLDYLAQQRAKRHSLPNDFLRRHSLNQATPQQLSDAGKYRKRPNASLDGIFRVGPPVQLDFDPVGPARLMAAPMVGVHLAEISTQPGETSGPHAWHGFKHGHQHHAVIVVDAAQRDAEGRVAGVSDAAPLRAQATATRQIQPTSMLPLQQGRRCRRDLTP